MKRTEYIFISTYHVSPSTYHDILLITSDIPSAQLGIAITVILSPARASGRDLSAKLGNDDPEVKAGDEITDATATRPWISESTSS